MYKKIENQHRISHEVAARIRTRIRQEKLKPGDKLPNEIELARLFGVSRPTVREGKIQTRALVHQTEDRKGPFLSIAQKYYRVV
jgi:DNA-binding FadR family transcriptional regulator